MSWISGLVGLLALLALLTIGTPIGIALLAVGIVGFMLVGGVTSTLGMVTSLPYSVVSNWGLFVLPMFLLLGSFASSAGIGEDLYDFAVKWFGRLPGGLAITTIVACAFFGFASGSSAATSAMFTAIGYPKMKQYNYDKRLAAGCFAAAGTLASIIPPSGVMVVYCLFNENLSLGDLMLGGILPGFMLAACLAVYIYATAKISPKKMPAIDVVVPMAEKLSSLRSLIWVAAIGLSIIGGIYTGIFTPNEAGAVGAAIAFAMLIGRRGWKMGEIGKAIENMVSITAMVYLIVVGAIFFSRFIVVTGLVRQISDLAISSTLPPTVVIILMLLIYLFLGTFLEAIACLALTMVIFVPVSVQLGINQIWLGILIVMLLEIGMLTPPVGLQVFVVAGVLKNELTVEDVFRGITPFFFVYLVAVAIIMIFPPIATWLPALSHAK